MPTISITSSATSGAREGGIEHRSRVDGVPYADWVRDGYLTATPGAVTDYDYIQETIRDLAGRYDIREVGLRPLERDTAGHATDG